MAAWHTGEINGRSKVSDAQVVEMRTKRVEEGVSYAKLATLYKLTKMQASRICRGLSRKAAGGPVDGGGSLESTVRENGRCGQCGAKVRGRNCLACDLRKGVLSDGN